MPPLDDAARAKFALARLVEGPLPRTGTFEIPDLDALNLAHAEADLHALQDPTKRLLADPGLLRRLTSNPYQIPNSWFSILDVLRDLDDLPADLALAWAVPAVDRQEATLTRSAVAVLARGDDPRGSKALLAALRGLPADPVVASVAAPALFGRGTPWREAALGVVLAGSTPLEWSRVGGWLDAVPDAADALVWWALCAETAGPRPGRSVGRFVAPVWRAARVRVDDAVWPSDPKELLAALAKGGVLAPTTVMEGLAYAPTLPGESSVSATRPWLESGLVPAARARCALARAGHETYVRAVRADLGGPDPLLDVLARECSPVEGESANQLEEARATLEAFLDVPVPNPAEGPPAARALDELAKADADGWRDLARKVLDGVRPAGSFSGLVHLAYERLRAADPAAADGWLDAALCGDDAGAAEAAAIVVRKEPRAASIAPLENALARPGTALDDHAIRLLLVWVASRAPDVTQGQRAALVRELERWLDDAPDAWAATLASALLDLGPAGAHAFALGLASPRRAIYLQTLLGTSGLVPLDVAEALLDGVDAETPAPDRRAAWIAAYRSAPAEAAPALAAARDRVDPSARSEVDDILESVRHRAPGRTPSASPSPRR